MRCKIENAHHYYKAARRQVYRWRERGGAMLKVGVEGAYLGVGVGC